MKAFVVDTVAAVAFFTIVATFSELVVAGMEPWKVLVARTIMIPIIVMTGRPYGIWRDWLMGLVRPSRTVAQLATDTLAFLTFQMPVYVGTLAVAGASSMEILAAAASAVFFMLVVGRPFGLFLDVVRRWARITPY